MRAEKGTCARLTWDDTNLFITMGSPTDQKTHLKGVFQCINCLTWLTQVWETFRMAIKGLDERQRKKILAVAGQEDGWNISVCVTSGKVFLTKSRVVSRQSYGNWVNHPSFTPHSFTMRLVLYMSGSNFTWPGVFAPEPHSLALTVISKWSLHRQIKRERDSIGALKWPEG